MKRWITRVGVGIAALALVLVGLGAYGTYVMYSPTSGPRIGKYAEPKKALLIIDVQEDYTNASNPLFADHETLIAATNRILDASSRLGLLPVYIRQEVPDNALGRMLSGGRALRGHPGARTDARVRQIAGAPDFPKERSDGFSNPALDEWLRAHQVDELYLVGLDAEYCVNRTARGALNRGYKVHVIRDAVTTRSSTPLSVLLEKIKANGADLPSLADLGA